MNEPEKSAAAIEARKERIAASQDSSQDSASSLRKVLDNPDASAEPFANRAEMVAAMRDPRYSDPSRAGDAYRAAVAQRVTAGVRSQPASEASPPQRSRTGVYRHAAPALNRDVPVARVLETFDVKPFLTRAERAAAFSDPRYQRDGSFRALVAAKLAVTDTPNLL